MAKKISRALTRLIRKLSPLKRKACFPMTILILEDHKRQPSLRARLNEIMVRQENGLENDLARPVRRVRCKECDWKYELGEGVDRAIGTARARAHQRETGHTNIRHRFDLYDVDEGQVELTGPTQQGGLSRWA